MSLIERQLQYFSEKNYDNTCMIILVLLRMNMIVVSDKWQKHTMSQGEIINWDHTAINQSICDK